MGDRLAGEVALITGAAKGMGEAMARRFVQEGARVVVADIDHDAGRALVAELGSAAIYVPLEVSDPAQWGRATEQALAAFGRIDILVNNAGFGRATPFDELPLEVHDRMTSVNQHGVFYGMRAVKPLMAARGKGSIINISSVDGIVGVPYMVSYVATKFAVRGMTRSAAVELGPLGIRVNSIHPGMIDTPLVRNQGPERYARTQRMVKNQPIPRLGRPEEVANVALFLASDEASFCTGAEFVVDGGHIAGPWREPPIPASP
jgi:3alpha(or 20beta)-hydroxysteroid dehydrogenase